MFYVTLTQRSMSNNFSLNAYSLKPLYLAKRNMQLHMSYNAEVLGNIFCDPGPKFKVN